MGWPSSAKQPGRTFRSKRALASAGKKALLLLPVWLALAVGVDLVATTADAQGAPPAFHAYQIDASLDPVKHVVTGRLKIRFTNTSRAPLEKLVFHLYLNAFRNRRSVFMRESRGNSNGERLRGVGSMELKTLLIDGQDALARSDRELTPGDFTQLSVPLATPLAPGAQLQIEGVFVSKLAPAFARSGYAKDFFCVAQWFPKLAKLEPDGTFASFPYHALGEFYADFADYEFTVRTPPGFVVGANGRLRQETKQGKEVARTFVIERALDAVWVAGESLQTRKEKSAGVTITYVYAKGYELALDEHAKITRAGLERYGKLFGPYPYSTLTVVIPPRRASGVSGMEYPGLFLTAGFWLPTPRSPGISGGFVTAHELAHQWFPMTLASNELRYPVLDEGFAQWSTIDLLRSLHGERGALSALLPFSRFELERLLAWSFGGNIAPGRPAYEYTANEYGTSVYSESAVVLETIRRVYGRKRFEEALRLYATENRFSHPTPNELGAAFDHVYGARFSERVLLPLLIDGERVGIRIVQAQTALEGSKYRTEVRARRTGKVPLPTWLAAYDEHGLELTRVRFPPDSDTLHTHFETKEPVARVVLDPDRALLVDSAVEDQVVAFTRSSRTSWTSRILAAAQALLAWVGP
jgi:hypothetical protein